jgi:4-amino-4-deoxy-L-arabinose transferase-like glycosyltransferase
VNPVIEVNAGPDSPQEVAAGLPEQRKTSREAVVERWLRARLNVLALAVVAAGFVVRVLDAARSYLNPDEALHYLLLNQASAFQAYKASLTNAHPPLLYFLVYFWHFLGRSELMLRLISVLAGTALCWVAYKWIGIVFGQAAGAMGLILVAFSPALIALSAEMRSYALLLFCETAALYFIEIAFREKSVRSMWYFSVFLYLAILSHYSALFFALAVGVYALARIAASELPRKVVVAWASGQAGALAIYGFLYVTHVSKIRNSISIWAMPFDQAYYRPGREGLFTFTWKRTLDIFSFLFENHYTALALVLLWIAAVAFLFVRDTVSLPDSPRSRHAGLLMLLPFVAAWGAAVGGFYPYVGSRHTVVLAPFAIAAVSFLISAIYGQKVWVAILIAVLLVTASNTSGKLSEPFITGENQSRTLMTAAVKHMQQSIPPGDLILTDYQSAIMISYYLCGPKVVIPVNTFREQNSKIDCNGHSIVSFEEWQVPPEQFSSQFEQMARANGLKSGDRVWVFDAGWGVNLARGLPRIFPKYRCLESKKFGENISVIPFVVDQDLSPAATVTNCPPPAFNSLIL